MLWISAAVFGITVLLLIQTMLLRMRRALREQHERVFAKLWEPLFAQCSNEVPRHLPRIARRDSYTFLSLWNYSQESLCGEAKFKLNRLAWSCDMDYAALRLLAKRSLRARLLAVTTLGHLQQKSSWSMLRSLLTDEHPLLSLAAARALLQVDAELALPELIVFFTRRHDWPLNKLASLLIEAGPDAISGPLARAVESAPPEEFPRLVRLLDCAAPVQALPMIRRILRAATDERVISACLQALREPQDAELARSYANYQRWFVRVQVVSALGRFGSQEDRDILVPALSDPVWWVRYRAAQALVNLLPFDEVRQIHKESPDRFAKDILAQAIAEKQSA